MPLEEGIVGRVPETLIRIGAPEFIGRDQWEYDFCSPGPGHTIRILWDNSHLKELPREKYKIMVNESPPRIAHVEILEPQWKQIMTRDHSFI
jgi:hypothetical protein